MTSFIEKFTGSLDDKRRWKQANNRVKQLPGDYRTTVEAIERYCTYFAPISDGTLYVQMSEDLVDLFEQAAADDTPIHTIVGEDPVAFAEDFLSNYTEGQWINKERERLRTTVDHVVSGEHR
jgi:DNA-binding ferritin-like protein (Dps family)